MIATNNQAPIQLPCFLAALVLGIPCFGAATTTQPPRSIQTNRVWEVLHPGEDATNQRDLFAQAASKMGTWSVWIDAVRIDRTRLEALAKTPSAEPLLRSVRENVRRPVDAEDLLFFLDDVLREGAKGLRGHLVWVPASRARKAGVFVHPDDVFRTDQPRQYGIVASEIFIDKPVPQSRAPRAKDGDPLGSGWCRRYPNPSGRRAKLAALNRLGASKTFGLRLAALMKQFSAQGATVLLASTVRDRRRGYLMWGAFFLSRASDEEAVNRALALLQNRNVAWNLHLPILWRHPDGWQATVEAARQMAGAYMVAYATEAGAKNSSHYSGSAADLSVFGLPRKLQLAAPDGTKHVFDLSSPDHTRDLSLSPELIAWIEKHYQFRKLKEDYPHWDDAAAPKQAP